MKKSQLIAAALAVGEHYPVFPTNDKMPAIGNAELKLAKGQGGYKIATQDPVLIKQYFSHRNAAEIAVPMGELSGLMCVDVDLYKGDEIKSWLDDNIHFFKDTLTHATRKGGRHYFFQHPGDNIKFPATLRAGVDVKATGNGYVCWPSGDGMYERMGTRSEAMPFPMELLRGALKAKGGTGNISEFDGNYNNASDDDLVSQILTGTELYPALRTLSYRLTSRRDENGHSMDDDQIIEILQTVMEDSVAAEPHGERFDDWQDRYSKIRDLVVSARMKQDPGNDFTDEDMAAMTAGQSFIKTQEMIAASLRPSGVQPEASADRIRELVGKVKLNDEEFVGTTIDGLHAQTIPPVEWIIPGVLPKKNSVALAGSSNVGKTRFLAALAGAISVGKPELIGLPPMDKAMPVLWIANEEYVEDIHRRLKAWARHYGVTGGVTIVIRGKSNGAMRLAGMNEVRTLEVDEDNIAILVAEIEKVGAALIIMDPYVTLASAMEENGSEAAEIIRSALTMLQSLTGVTTLFAHHTPKNAADGGDGYRGSLEALRGSGAIGGALDVAFTLSNWWPSGKDQRKAWKDNYLEHELSRWIVLDVAKIREGKRIKPVVYELVGQAMDDGEGMDIGVCRLTTAAEAEMSLHLIGGDAACAIELAAAIINTMGEGSHKRTTVHKAMKAHPMWPSTADRLQHNAAEALSTYFDAKVTVLTGTVQLVNSGTDNKPEWAFSVTETEEE